MSKKNRYNAEEKFNILMEYEDCKYSITDLCKKYDIANVTLYRWMKRYKRQGVEGLKKSNRWKQYSQELKYAAVLDYLSGEYSTIDIVDKYEISSLSVLDKWLKRYNSHRELKDTGKGMTQSMTKGRSTTLEERLQIAKYCINNDKNYQKTADMFNVSYQQVYAWVKKFETNGNEGLEDRRGKNKENEVLTEEEKVRRDMQKMKLENERLRAENAFLKKLEELERRGY